MNNTFKDIPGYEGLYAINKQGDVWSYPKKVGGGKILKPLNMSGYPQVNLHKYGTRKTEKIHRILAKTHIPNPENKPCINHKNGIRNDYNIENLEWCTVSENTIHKFRVLGYSMSNEGREKMAKICVERDSMPIMQLTKEGILCRVYKSCSEAARITNYSQGNISRSATRNRTTGGYFWKYITS